MKMKCSCTASGRDASCLKINVYYKFMYNTCATI